MTLSRFAGWILLVLGLIIIVWTLLFSYNIFTGKGSVFQFFSVSEEPLVKNTGTQNTEEQIEKIISGQLKAFLPVQSIDQLLNLAVWSMLSFILIFGGSQISGLGIKLLK